MRRNTVEKFQGKTVRINYSGNKVIIGTMEKTNGIFLVIRETDGKKRHAYIAKINAVVELDKKEEPIESTRFTNY